MAGGGAQPGVDELWRAYLASQRSDLALRNRLVEHYLPWAAGVTKWLRLVKSQMLDHEACRSAACAMLLSAVERFDPRRGVKFETFARLVVLGGFFDEARRQGWISHDEYRKRRIRGELPKTFSITVIDQDGPRAEKLLDRRRPSWETEEFFEDLTKMLGFRDRVQLYLYFYCDLTMREIGGIIGVCESRISQTISHALNRMRIANNIFEGRETATRRTRHMTPKPEKRPATRQAGGRSRSLTTDN